MVLPSVSGLGSVLQSQKTPQIPVDMLYLSKYPLDKDSQYSFLKVAVSPTRLSYNFSERTNFGGSNYLSMKAIGTL